MSYIFEEIATIMRGIQIRAIFLSVSFCGNLRIVYNIALGRKEGSSVGFHFKGKIEIGRESPARAPVSATHTPTV